MITRYGWHILDSSRVLGYNDERRVTVGKRLEYRDVDAEETGIAKRPPRLCSQGMHAAPSISAAEAYGDIAPGNWLCRVLVEGTNYTSRNTSKSQASHAKFVGSHRTVLGMITLDEYERLSEHYSGRTLVETVLRAMAARNRKNNNHTEVK